MIELRASTCIFDGGAALRDVNLRLTERRIAIIGANGSGKSTLARLLNGLALPTSGEVLVNGVSTARDRRAALRSVGLVFQNPEHQIVMPTVEEDLAFGPSNLGMPPAEIEKRMAALLASHGLADKRAHAAHLLSGGEKKLLTLLSVLVMEPQTVVLDEPTASLDLASRRRISAALDGLAQRVITITHDLDFIARYDRAILLSAGEVAADGAPPDVIRHYLVSIA
jgi:biotin transport system ATP-binding protein